MNIENMTPQEAAEAIAGTMQTGLRISEVTAAIAAACQHFYERGKADAINPQNDVRKFMAAFGQMPYTPQWPDQATMDLRVRLVAKAFCEWLRDSGYEYSLKIQRAKWNEDGSWNGDDLVYKHSTLDTNVCNAEEVRHLPKSADALIDLVYVTIGSLLAMGIDMWPLWAEVQRANMAKAGGPVVNGKQLKPEGWQPPDIAGLLKAQGWEDADNAVS